MCAMDKQTKKKSIPKPTHFGKNLRFLRRLNGLSQQELANQLHLKRNNIASYESGSAEPSAKVYLRICRHFNKSPQLLLDTLMVEQPLETTQIVLPIDNSIRQNQFEEALSQFISQTNEMTKIFDGYTSLIEMKNIDNSDTISRELYSSFTDLLDLLQTLIRSNWDFMHEIVPSDITEQNRSKPNNT